MKEISIIAIGPGHRFAATLVDWIMAEWGEKLGQSREEVAERLFTHLDCPPTHAAADPGAAIPLGVIAFTRFKSPEDGEMSVWVDGLFVAPEHREARIGSRLIQAADDLVRPFANRMYAYTDVPRLYERLGWREVVAADESGCCRLRRDLVAGENLRWHEPAGG